MSELSGHRINDLRAVTTLFALRGVVPLAAGLALLPSLGVVGVAAGVALGELAGPVLFGGLYLRKQLRRFGSASAPRWQPAALGAAITSAFLIWQASGNSQFGFGYGAALLGVLATIVWGWRGINEEVRSRALGLLRRS